MVMIILVVVQQTDQEIKMIVVVQTVNIIESTFLLDLMLIQKWEALVTALLVLLPIHIMVPAADCSTPLQGQIKV